MIHGFTELEESSLEDLLNESKICHTRTESDPRVASDMCGEPILVHLKIAYGFLNLSQMNSWPQNLETRSELTC